MSIYKSESARKTILDLYDSKLKACNIEYEETYVSTSAGDTHVIITGDKSLPPIVVFHGINAGAPLALEAIRNLNTEYRIYGIDTVGQATKSAETRLPMKGDAYSKWICETLDGLKLDQVPVVAISYGAFLLQKLLTYNPERISKGIFVVPSGFVNGDFWPSMKKLSLPLLRFLITKKEEHLLKFMDAFFIEKDEHSVKMQKSLLLGFKMDYRRPTLMSEKDVTGVKFPLYVMVADNDVFFPGDRTLARCKKLFPTLKETYILKNSKHIPNRDRYPEISQKVHEWLRK